MPFIQSASAHSAGPVYGFVSLWCVGLISFSFCDQILCEKPSCEDRFQIRFISCESQPGASKMLLKWSQKDPTWSQQEPKWSQKGLTLLKMVPKGDLKTLKKRCPKKGRLQDAPRRCYRYLPGAFLVERVAPGIDFGGHFGALFHQKCDPKSIPKSNLKKTRKT